MEDAQRRDFTINSLYYNINERRIEDYTGMVRTDGFFLKPKVDQQMRERERERERSAKSGPCSQHTE